MEKTKVLILSTSSVSLSLMAHGFLNSFSDKLDVSSICDPLADPLSQSAVKTMNNVGIDIVSLADNCTPENALSQNWDVLITICRNNGDIPALTISNVTKRLYVTIDDRTLENAPESLLDSEYSFMRDIIKRALYALYTEDIIGVVNQVKTWWI